MGRKRSHRDETRTKIISARLTQDTYDIITQHAERLGLTRAGYVEHLIENRPLKIVRGQMDELTVPLINELKRIGNNLNQIAHARNAGSDIDPSHFHTVLADIIRVICRNELTRKHYAEAYTEVVGEDRDDTAVDPARRSMPPPVHPPEANGWPLTDEMPSPARSATRYVSNDNPPPLQAAPPWQQGHALQPQQPVPRPPALIPDYSIPPTPPLSDPLRPRAPRLTPPHSLSSARRHDPSPPSAWSKLLRRLHLRSP